MPPKRTQPPETPPDLLPERAYEVLKAQLAKLQEMKGRDYRTVDATENELFQLTAKLVMRSFGSGTYESSLKSCISELELDLPDTGIKGVYEPGEEYEFYRDVSNCLKLAQKEILVIDPYLNTGIFNEYASAIPRTVKFRLLSANIPSDVMTLAQKYVSGGNFALRNSNSIHDRVLFADNRVWVIGQSLKDAARKKPTYMVEHDEPLMRGLYESIWQAAAVIF